MPIDIFAGLPTLGGVVSTPAAGATTNPTNPTNLYTGPTGGYGSGSDPYAPGGSASAVPRNAAKANLAASAEIAKLSELVNALNAANQTALNQSRLGPQGQQIQANLLTNTERQSAGLLDPQTEAMLQQGIAEGGANAGFGVDSSNLAAAYRRALGLTIEGTEAQAHKQYLDLLAANPSAPLYNAAEGLMTPAQYAATAAAQAQRQLEQQRLDQQYRMFREEQALRYPGGSIHTTTYNNAVPANPFGVYQGSNSGMGNPSGASSGGYSGYSPSGGGSILGTGNTGGGVTYEDWINFMDPEQQYEWYGSDGGGYTEDDWFSYMDPFGWYAE